MVFPPGVSLQTASNRELATAVKAAIFQRPEQAPEIVSRTIAELAKGGRLIPQRVPPSARDAAVTAVLVKKGQKVTTGQILAVLEVQGKKMKYTSTADGVIQSLGFTPDMTRLNSDSLALIAQSSEYSLTAIRQVIMAAVLASPSSIAKVVAAAASAAPTVSGVILRTAQEALPDQAETIAKAIPPVVAPREVQNTGGQPSTSAEAEVMKEMDVLKSEGKLGDPQEVSSAVRKVMKNHTETKEISAPLGARVIAVHKHAGEVVHKGDKILTLRLPDGSSLPILAQSDGVMQELSVSKGGVIGNSRPRNARSGTPPDPGSGVILITMITR